MFEAKALENDTNALEVKRQHSKSWVVILNLFFFFFYRLFLKQSTQTINSKQLKVR